MRRRTAALGFVLTGVLLGLAGRAGAGVEAPPDDASPPTPAELVEAGDAWRIRTAYGPVRVWVPNGYDPQTAAVVVYVHDYYVDVDRAWHDHHLAEQFASSGVNAMFVVCDAPEDSAERVTRPSIGSLLRELGSGVDRPLPRGPAVAIAHGAGARTVAGWLREDRLRAVALLDSAIVSTRPFSRWVTLRPQRRLIAVEHPRSPMPLGEARLLAGFVALDEGARASRQLRVRSEVGHRELVTGGIAIPWLLHALDLTSVRATGDASP